MAIKPLNSVAGFSVGEVPTTTVILANGDITTTNITMTGVSNLNSVSNVKITGGTSGQFLTTDGTGNLSFATISTGSLINGNSNVEVLPNSNITFSVAGTSNVVVFSSTGANIDGYINVTGNANIGNIGTAQLLASANVTAPQFISNTSTGTAPFVVSSTTKVANLNADTVDGYDTATANTAGTIAVRDNNGNLSANYFIGNGSQLTGLNTDIIANGNSNVSIPSANGNVNITAAGNTTVVVTGTGANITGYANVTGNVLAGNVYANSGTIGAQTLKGEGGNISNIQGANVSGTVSSATTAGTVTSSSQPNITSVGTLTSLSVTGNVSASNFVGTLANGNSTVAIPSGNGNVNISAVGNTTLVVTGTGANITGYANVSGNVSAGNISATNANVTTANVSGNVEAGGVKTDNLYYANGTPWDMQQPGGSNTQIQYNDDGAFGGSAAFTFNSTSNLVSISANLSANNVNATSYITAGNVYANSGTIGAQTLKGEGGNISNIQGSNVSGAVSSASTAGTVTASSQPNITSVGTLTSLSVTGNLSAGNVDAGNLLTANYVSGTLTTSSQPNVTSVGTLTGLDVNGNIVAANITANTGVFTGNGSGLSAIAGANVTGEVSYAATANAVAGANVSGAVAYATTANSVAGANVSGQVANALVAGTVYSSSQPNITSVGTLTSLTVTNKVTAGQIQGDGGNISNIQGANVSGTVGSATNASAVLTNVASTGTFYPTFVSSTSNGNYSLTSNTAYSANIANGYFEATLLGGTLTTASQPNITSVGTLSSLSVTGNIDANNISTTNTIIAGNGLQVTTGTLEVLAGNLDVTGNINVTGNLNYSNVTDLVVGDPLIYIGANNPGDTYDLGIVASYDNGTYQHTGIARNAADDIWTFFDGVETEPTTVIDWANATYPSVKMGNLFTTANANIGGYANVVGNITAANIDAGNLLTANYVSGTLTTASQPNITSVGTLGSLSVTSDITAGNVYANSGTIGAQTLKGEGGNISNIQGANVSGTVSSATSATTAGTVTASAQGNITSVGTLTGLNVNGNIVAANITANTGVFTGNGSGLSAIAGANVTGEVSYAATANAVAGANVSGQVGYAAVANSVAGSNVSGQVSNALVAGTVYSSSQPNITSVGTLISLGVTGNISSGNISGTNGNLTTANISGNVILGNSTVATHISWASLTTSSISSNQAILTIPVTGITGIEFLVKGVDSSGSKYSVATVQAVTDGSNVDYSTYGGVNLGGYTGALSVAISSGDLKLQVTPASANSTVWTTQYRFI